MLHVSVCMFYHGVNGKGNGLGVIKSVLQVKRVSAWVMSLKMAVLGVMFSVVIDTKEIFEGDV